MTARCFECGEPFAPRTGQLFCCDAHKRTFANRQAARGKTIAPLAAAWRRKRGTGDVAKQCFADMCRILDKHNEEDRRAGRRPIDEYAAATLATNHHRKLDK